MRYAVFSDIHSNLEAFRALLDAFAEIKIDHYLFLGDIVGYGADPKGCIALLRQLNPVMVAGNHDWAAVDLTDIDYFNEWAKAAVLWTKENISENDRLFLKQMILVKESESFCLVHGTLNHPEKFDYMSDGERASKTFYLLGKQVCFVGHSHCPGVFVDDGEKLSYHEPKKLLLKKEYRYIINAGSVGQPRDRDPMACFCIYDESEQSVEFRRIPYDISEAQKKILEAGLPRILADRLALGT